MSTLKQYKTLKKDRSQRSEGRAPVAAVAIRVKNEVKGFDAFWQSLRAQTYFDLLEITILDSGSTDGTLDIVGQKDCNLYTIESHEFSFGPSCNLMLELTSAPYVFFFSGHVELKDERLIEDTLNFINGRNISGYFRQIPNIDFGSSIYDDAFLKYRFPRHNNGAALRVGTKNSFSNAASVISREHWEENNFKDVIFGEDELWAVDVLRNNGSLYYFHGFEVAHSHGDSASEVTKRVRKAAMVKYPEGTPLLKVGMIFFRVFAAISLNSGSFFKALKFARAHASAYLNTDHQK